MKKKNVRLLKCIGIMTFFSCVGYTPVIAQNTYPWPAGGFIGIGTNTPVSDLQIDHNSGSSCGGIIFGGGCTPITPSPAFIINDKNLDNSMSSYAGHSIMEIWRSNTIYPATAPYVNNLVFSVNDGGPGIVSINKASASSTLDVGGDINADASITARGNANVMGGKIDMTTSGAVGDVSRVIDANSQKAGLSLQSGVPGGSVSVGGAYIYLHAGLEPTNPGGMDFSVTTTGGQGYTFQSWDGHSSWNALMNIGADGKVAIGQPLIWPHNVPNTYKLYVQDGILTEKLKVAHITGGSWSDFVFASDYNLMPLHDVETYVKQNKHLPEVPSAEEVSADGIDMVTMDSKLLQKIEELTLYVIDQQIC